MTGAFDPNVLCTWLVACWTAAMLVRVVLSALGRAHGPQLADQGYVLSVVGLTLLAGLELWPAWAGTVAVGLWSLVVWVPVVLPRLAAGSRGLGTFRREALVFRGLAVLRPLAGHRDLARLYGALHQLTQGERARPLAALARIEREVPALALTVAAERHAAQGDWEGLRKSFEERQRRGRGVPRALLGRYLRCLGETADLGALVKALERSMSRLWEDPEQLEEALLLGYAFAGEPAQLTSLLERLRVPLDPVSREAWLATAELTGGKSRRGIQRLLEARVRADALQQVGINRRLEFRLMPGALAFGAGSHGDRLLRALEQRHRVLQRTLPGTVRWRLAPANLVLACLIAGPLVTGMGLGPAETYQWLLWGGLDTVRVLSGEWWRVLTAIFLHAGLLHGGMNLAALVVAGPFVERRVGALWFTVLYLLAGVVPGVTHVLLTRWGATLPTVAVGASGAVMGALGAAAALLTTGLVDHQVQRARGPLWVLGLVIAGQWILDLLVPVVDVLGHTMGVAVGFAVASRFSQASWRRTLGVAVPVAALAIASVVVPLPWRALPCGPGEVTFCRLGCDAGMPDLCAALGAKYLAGEDVPQDVDRAIMLLDDACRSGVPYACTAFRSACAHGGADACETLSTHAR